MDLDSYIWRNFQTIKHCWNDSLGTTGRGFCLIEFIHLVVGHYPYFLPNSFPQVELWRKCRYWRYSHDACNSLSVQMINWWNSNWWHKRWHHSGVTGGVTVALVYALKPSNSFLIIPLAIFSDNLSWQYKLTRSLFPRVILLVGCKEKLSALQHGCTLTLSAIIVKNVAFPRYQVEMFFQYVQFSFWAIANFNWPFIS